MVGWLTFGAVGCWRSLWGRVVEVGGTRTLQTILYWYALGHLGGVGDRGLARWLGDGFHEC
jgi:hypothetical protein